ncbi:hypothetical protein G6W51_16310 [Streptomyces coelicolor]|nr:hypothetical protein [Streptomyces coelicolor]
MAIVNLLRRTCFAAFGRKCGVAEGSSGQLTCPPNVWFDVLPALKGRDSCRSAARCLGGSLFHRAMPSVERRGLLFPKPVKVGRTSLWPVEGIDAWRAAHPARRRRDAK